MERSKIRAPADERVVNRDAAQLGPVQNGGDVLARGANDTLQRFDEGRGNECIDLANKLGSLALGDQEEPVTRYAADNVTLCEEDNLPVRAKAPGKTAGYAVSAPEAPSWGDSRVGVVYDAAMLLHEDPAGHVECPGRIERPYQRLEACGLLQRCCRIHPRPAETAELLLGHPQEHVDSVEAERDVEGVSYIEFGDIYFNEATPSCARLAAGCCIASAQAVAGRDIQRAFALVRPPGHHAECSRAMGFCFYNNVALAALRLLETSGGVSKVVILDWDVHHGNGIQNMFYDDARVLYISLHRGKGFYPHTGHIRETGRGKGWGYNVNIPFPKAGFGDADYLAVFSTLVEPLCRAFDPDVVLVSAGFDAANGDPLGGMKVSPECYGHMTQRLLKFAGGHVVLVLEGGYNLDVMSDAIQNCMRVLLGEAPPELKPSKKLKPETEGLVFKVARQLAGKWPEMEGELIEQRWDAVVAEYRKGVGKGEETQ